MVKGVKILLLYFLLFQSFGTFSQDHQVQVQHYSVKEGLSGRAVQSFCQSKDGYIWIATKHALNRYDGRNFQHTRNMDSSQKGYILKINISSDNLLWVFYGERLQNQDNLQFLVVKDVDIIVDDGKQIFSFEAFFEDAPFAPEDIAGSYQDADFGLWLWTRKGEVYLYNGRFEKKLALEGVENITAISIGESGEIWLAYNKLLVKATENGAIEVEDSLHFQVDRMGFFQDEVFWIHPQFLTGKGDLSQFYFYTKKEKQPLERYSVESEVAIKLNKRRASYFSDGFVDRKDRLWTFNRLELEVYDKEKKWSKEFTEAFKSTSEASVISTLFADKDNNIFVGTNDGFFIVSIEEKVFTNYLNGAPELVSVRSIIDFSVDSLLVFTYGGNYFVNKKTEVIHRVLNEKELLAYGAIMGTDGRLYTGSHGPAIHQADPYLKKIKQIRFENPAPFRLAAAKVYEDLFTGRIWVGVNKGLAYLDEQREVMKRWDTGAAFPEFNDQYIRAFYQNDEGMWLCTSNGLYRYQEGIGLVEHFEDFPNLNFNYLHEDEEGMFWIATLGGGLLRWDRAKDEVLQFTTKQGLSNDVIYTVFEDEKERLWLPSDRGLMCFDKKKQSTITYFPIDGIPHEEFNNNAYCRSSDGRFYFGGLDGLVGFDPNDPRFDEPKYNNLVLSSIRKTKPQTGKMVEVLDVWKKEKKVKIQPGETNVELNFALLNFRGPRQINYQYEMEGTDDQPTFTNEGFIRINQLPYGNYTLKIKAFGGGQWTAEVLAIPIEVLKPFYQEAWFIFLMIVVGMVLVFLTVLGRIQFLKNERKRLEREVQKRTEEIHSQNVKLANMNESKDQFFGILAHDLRGPMLSFRGLSQKFQYLVEQKDEKRLKELGASIDAAYQRLERLLDNLLNWALVQKGSLPYNPETINLVDLAAEIIALFQEVADLKNITIENKVAPTCLVSADPNALSAVLRNLVNNAIKYSNSNSAISIYGNMEEGRFQCSVKDEGEGIASEDLAHIFEFNPRRQSKKDRKNQGTGLGLQLCKELIELHRGKIWIESTKGKGTQVFFAFPVNGQNGKEDY